MVGLTRGPRRRSQRSGGGRAGGPSPSAAADADWGRRHHERHRAAVAVDDGAVVRGFGGKAAADGERIVLGVDEELGRGRMRVRGTGHGDRVLVVLEAVLGFVFNGGVGRLLLHAWLETAALDHETVDDAMEDGAVIMAGFHVGQEVGDRFRGFLVEQFDGHGAQVGGDDYIGHFSVLSSGEKL